MPDPKPATITVTLSPAAVALLAQLVTQAAAPGPQAAALAELYAAAQTAQKQATAAKS